MKLRMKMKAVSLALVLLLSLTACGQGQQARTDGQTELSQTESQTEEQAQTETVSDTADVSDQVAGAGETVAREDVSWEGMTAIEGSQIKDGIYDVTVDSSSSMFKIVSCQLTVENGEMTAVMTMSGTGYLYLYMGTGEEAAAASEESYIPYEENADGAYTFTVPVEALDACVNCAAYSKNKEKWYDRTLVFRADSLDTDAFNESVMTTAEELGLADGEYTVDVTLEGGSGRASVESPAKIQVSGGEVTATIIWSSSNYDYMVVDGSQYLPVNTEGNAVFEIPVVGFNYKMPVSADTTAMSTPHEIEYTLYFDGDSITEKQ